jgi:hypothetical protein
MNRKLGRRPAAPQVCLNTFLSRSNTKREKVGRSGIRPYQPKGNGVRFDRSSSSRFGVFEEALQMADACWVAQFAERLRLDLADAFASDFVLLSHFFQCAGITVR